MPTPDRNLQGAPSHAPQTAAGAKPEAQRGAKLGPESGTMSGDDARMIREAGKLSLLTLLSRVLGLVREMTKAAFLGTGWLSDAFTVAFSIPNFMRRLFAEGSIAVAFIPTFKRYLHEGDEKATQEFLSSMLSVLTITVGAVIAAGMAATPLIVRAFGSDPAETIILTRIMFPFLGLVSIAAMFQGILNSFGVFVPGGIAPVLFNLCFIFVPSLLGGLTANPARAMAVGVLTGGLAQAACQLPAVLATKKRFGFISPRRAFTNPGMRKVFALIAPTIVGMAAYQLNDLVSTFFASRVMEGTVSSLQYSLRLQELILGIFAVSAGTVLLPSLEDAVCRADWGKYAASLGRGLRSVLLATLPVAILSMLLGREIVTLLFKKGGFNDESVRLTQAAFFWHQAGVAFIAFNRVAAPAFYAKSDSKTPTIAGIASVIVNIALVFFMAAPLRGAGIAGALSIAAAVNSLVLVLALLRMGKPPVARELAASGAYALRLLLLSLVALVPAYFSRIVALKVFGAHHSRLVAAGLPIIFVSFVYGGVGILLLVLSRDTVAFEVGRAVSRKLAAKLGRS